MLIDHSSFNNQSYEAINDSLKVLVQEFEKTKLTKEEAIFFGAFKESLTQFLDEETKYFIQDSSKQQAMLTRTLNEKYEYLYLKLRQLSQIQKTEGKRLIDESTKIISSSHLTLQFEMVVLIIIGVVVQALIFSARSTQPKINQKPNLN